MIPLLVSPPSFGRIVREQSVVMLRGMRLETGLILGFFALVSMLIATGAIDPVPTFEFAIVPITLMNLAGFALPFGIWRHTPAFGPSYFAAQPVERHDHMLARAAAGWLWTLGAMTLTLAWVWCVVWFTGGDLELAQTRPLATDPGGAPVVIRAPGWALWSPYAAVTVAYLFGSAWVLGIRRPVVWLLGFAAACIVLAMLDSSGRAEDVLQWLVIGPFGLDQLITGGLETLDTEVILADGRRRVVWSSLPRFKLWISAVGFWFVVSLSSFVVALLRPREV